MEEFAEWECDMRATYGGERRERVERDGGEAKRPSWPETKDGKGTKLPDLSRRLPVTTGARHARGISFKVQKTGENGLGLQVSNGEKVYSAKQWYSLSKDYASVTTKRT